MHSHEYCEHRAVWQCVRSPIFTSRKISRIWLVEFFILKNWKNSIGRTPGTRNLPKMLQAPLTRFARAFQDIFMHFYVHVACVCKRNIVFACSLFVEFCFCVLLTLFSICNRKISECNFFDFCFCHFAHTQICVAHNRLFVLLLDC